MPDPCAVKPLPPPGAPSGPIRTAPPPWVLASRSSAAMNRPEAASSSVSMISAPSRSATLVPRAKTPKSPIQSITSRWRSRPVARFQLLLDRVAAAGHAGEGVHVEVEQLPEVGLRHPEPRVTRQLLDHVARLPEQRGAADLLGHRALEGHAVLVGVERGHQ